MHIDIAPSLIVSGNWTGCLSGAVMGNVAIDFIFPPHNLAAGMSVNVGWSLNDPLAEFATINFANMTMCVYFSHGGANCVPIAFGTKAGYIEGNAIAYPPIGTPTARIVREVVQAAVLIARRRRYECLDLTV